MKANIEWPVMQNDEGDLDTKEVQRRAQRVWKTIGRYLSKHVTIEKDAIFKDPDWPHLWDHKR